jgi:hypothetical protein
MLLSFDDVVPLLGFVACSHTRTVVSAAVSDIPPMWVQTGMFTTTVPVLLMVTTQIPAATISGAPFMNQTCDSRREVATIQQFDQGHTLFSPSARQG